MASGMTPKSSVDDPVPMESDTCISPSSSNAENATKSSTSKEGSNEKLSEFVSALDNYVHPLPDPVVSFYLQSAGLETTDPRVIRLISMATQKFVSDIATNAFLSCKMRARNQKVKPEKIKYILTEDDLSSELEKIGFDLHDSSTTTSSSESSESD